MSNVNELRGTIWSPKRYDTITRFTLSISRKNKKTDEWESGYLNCVVMNEVVSKELTEKMRVEVKGNLTPNEWQDKEGKVRHDIQLWVEDIKFEESKQKEGPQDDGELPFV